MQVLLVSYMVDGTDVGEALHVFNLAKELSKRVKLTILCFERHGRTPLRHQLPDAEIVTWPEPGFLRRFERLNATLKPAYPLLYIKIGHWIRQQHKRGRRFDVAHQMMPLAARYPCPLQGQGIPYIVGPLGGSLPTPSGFTGEMETAPWYTNLRAIDGFRFRYDPWLRRSYRDASLILGIGPYMADHFSSISLKNFEVMLEMGIDDLPPVRPQREGKDLRLLHVGRGVRTKGLRDTVRAMSLLADLPNITLTSAGGGDEIQIARAEAEKLGVADRIEFLGKVSRDHVEELYSVADIFVFPSFREPAGGVLYEAMRWGLPIITVNYGGPGVIVDEATGIKLDLSTPEALTKDIANAIRALHHDPDRRRAMGSAARIKVEREGLWRNKTDRLIRIYEKVRLSGAAQR